MNNKAILLGSWLCTTAVVGMLGVACTNSNAVKEDVLPDGTSPNSTATGTSPTATATATTTVPPVLFDAGADASPTDCFSGTPTTHAQLINACTTAVRISKNPVLSNLLPDGGRPSLP